MFSFKQEYSAYPCNGSTSSDKMFATTATGTGMKQVNEGSITPEEEAEWDIPYSYFYYNGGITTDWSYINGKNGIILAIHPTI